MDALSGQTTRKGAFTIAGVSAMTGFSRQIVTRIFENKPGVIILERPTSMNKRRYRTIRIPHAMYQGDSDSTCATVAEALRNIISTAIWASPIVMVIEWSAWAIR